MVWLVGCCSIYSQHFDKVPEAELHRKLAASKNSSEKIALLIELATNHIELSRDINHPKSIDSAKYFSNRALKLSKATQNKDGVARAYIAYSQVYQIIGDLDLAEKYAQSAINIYVKLKDKPGIASAYRILMYSKESVRDFNETVAIGLKAQKAYKEAGDKKMQATMGEDIAYFLMGSGRLEESLKVLEETVQLYKEMKFGKVQYAYSSMCIISNQLGRYEKAIEYSQKAINAAEKYNDTSLNVVQVYNYSGIAYLSLKNYNKAFECFKKAYKISKKYNDIGFSCLLLTNMIEILMKSKKINEAGSYVNLLKKDYHKLSPADQFEPMSCLIKYYVQLKKHEQAVGYVEKALKASDTMKTDDIRQVALYVGIIDYHFANKKYGIARKYVGRYKILSENVKSPKKLAEVYHMLFRIDSAEGNFTSAIKHYKLESKYKDSLLNEAKNKEIAALEIKYETNKKEKELQQNKEKNRLLSLESSLQKSKLEKANLIKNISLGGIILLLITFLLLYSSYRIKQKTNRILESQKNEINQKNNSLEKLVTEKEWLLKEVHHRVKNNLQMVMSLLNAQSFYLKDNAAMTAIRESQHRIHSMSLIHKKLYQSENVVSINMEVYIKELVQYFKETFDTGQRIQFVLDITPIELSTSQAVPLGLILNEAITNSIKHAFTKKENGTITIQFKNSNDDHLTLSIKDNGEGIVDELKNEHFQSLGMKLIKGFSDDLDANLSIENNNGLTITVTFLNNEKFTENGITQP